MPPPPPNYFNFVYYAISAADIKPRRCFSADHYDDFDIDTAVVVTLIQTFSGWTFPPRTFLPGHCYSDVKTCALMIKIAVRVRIRKGK